MVNVKDALCIKDNYSKNRDKVSILIKNTHINFKPKVSVCVPTYKRVDTLRVTLESIMSQENFTEFDVIVSDNNPERNDETEKYISNLKNDRLKYYKSSIGLGMYGNLNRLTELADAELVVCVHDDDILFPNFLSDTVRIMEKYNYINFLFPAKVIWNEISGQSFPKQVLKHSKYKIVRSSYWDYFMGNPCPPTGFIFRKKEMLQLGGYDYDSYPSNDLYFNIKAVTNSNAYFYTKPLWIYRWGVNTSLKKETQIGFARVGIPLRKWISQEKTFYKIIYPVFFKSYCKNILDNLKTNFKNLKKEDLPYWFKIKYSFIDKIEIKLFCHLWGKASRIRQIVKNIFSKSY